MFPPNLERESTGISLFIVCIFVVDIWIRIQRFKVSGSGSRVLGRPKIEEKKSAGIFFLRSFWSKIAIYTSLGLHKRRPALNREYPALKKMKFINRFYFSVQFLPSWSRALFWSTSTQPSKLAGISLF
jgi:hypothetical protein